MSLLYSTKTMETENKNQPKKRKLNIPLSKISRVWLDKKKRECPICGFVAIGKTGLGSHMKTHQTVEEFTVSFLKEKLFKLVKGQYKGHSARDMLSAVSQSMELLREEEAKKESQRKKVIKVEIDEKKLQRLINWSPEWPQRHEKQFEVLSCPASEIIIFAGRQGGKSALCAYEILKELLKDNRLVCLIAPTYTQNEPILEYLIRWIDKGFKDEIKYILRPPQVIRTVWGSKLLCKSTEQPGQILGRGYDLVVVDECAQIPEDIWNIYIAPATGIKIGRYFYITTPRGRNWVWKLWTKAKKENRGFHWESIENPYFEKSKWEQEKKRLPELIFQQEYQAICLEEATVFRGLDNCLDKNLKFENYNVKHLYSGGVDLGKYETDTAVSMLDLMTNQLVFYTRFKMPDWAVQKREIKSIMDKYEKSLTLMDASSISAGDVFVDELSDEGYNVDGYKIQGPFAKNNLIENLMVKIQNRAIKIPDIPETQDLIEELRAYTFEIAPSGRIVYKAPSGMLEDGVISLALACFEIRDQPLAELKEGQSEIYLPPEQEF